MDNEVIRFKSHLITKGEIDIKENLIVCYKEKNYICTFYNYNGTMRNFCGWDVFLLKKGKDFNITIPNPDNREKIKILCEEYLIGNDRYERFIKI